MLDALSVQMVSTPFNISNHERNVEAVLNESLNQFNLIQHSFNKLSTFYHAFNNVERPVQTPPTFVSTTAFNAC